MALCLNTRHSTGGSNAYIHVSFWISQVLQVWICFTFPHFLHVLPFLKCLFQSPRCPVHVKDTSLPSMPPGDHRTPAHTRKPWAHPSSSERRRCGSIFHLSLETHFPFLIFIFFCVCVLLGNFLYDYFFLN